MKTASYSNYTSEFDPEKAKSKKVNFMIKLYVLEDLEKFIPAGKRSEFVNGALRQALKKASRKKAYEKLMEMHKNQEGLDLGMEEIVKMVRKDRESGH